MNWYKEYQTEWKEIIETVARELGRSEQMVEKDTIQSMFLYEDISYDYAIENGIAIIAESDVFVYKK